MGVTKYGVEGRAVLEQPAHPEKFCVAVLRDVLMSDRLRLLPLQGNHRKTRLLFLLDRRLRPVDVLLLEGRDLDEREVDVTTDVTAGDEALADETRLTLGLEPEEPERDLDLHLRPLLEGDVLVGRELLQLRAELPEVINIEERVDRPTDFFRQGHEEVLRTVNLQLLGAFFHRTPHGGRAG